MKQKDRFYIELIYQDGERLSLTNDRSNTTAVQLLIETLELFETLSMVNIRDRVTGERAVWMR